MGLIFLIVRLYFVLTPFYFLLKTAAIKEGLNSIIPAAAFTLFTAEELETVICGKTDFSVELLKVRC
jgi:hypothetical protein